MTAVDNDMLVRLIKREGGYVNHAADRGGATNHGITQATLAAYRRRPVTERDVQDLTLGEAVDIYRSLYLRPFEGLHSRVLREQCFDAAVQHGAKTAARWLQGAASGLRQDGVVGPRTLEAINALPWRRVAAHVLAERLAFYGNILRRDRTQAVFAGGWMARMGEMVALALTEDS